MLRTLATHIQTIALNHLTNYEFGISGLHKAVQTLRRRGYAVKMDYNTIQEFPWSSTVLIRKNGRQFQLRLPRYDASQAAYTPVCSAELVATDGKVINYQEAYGLAVLINKLLDVARRLRAFVL